MGNYYRESARGVSDGLATTLRVLGRTDNEAAVRVLIPALDSRHESIREGALEALLGRRSAAGGREILGRLHAMPDRWKEIIRERRGGLSRTLRDAVLGADRQLCENACRAAVWFGEYDLIATLLNVLEDQTTGNRDLAAAAVLGLVDALHEALAGPRDARDRRDPQLVRQHVLASLEASLRRYVQHERTEVIGAFLCLVGRDNATLKTILQDPHHPTFLPMVETLSTGEHGAVLRLLLSFLDDPHCPSAVLPIIGKRGDRQFVRSLLRKIGREPSPVVGQNLKRITAIGWTHDLEGFLEQLDDAAQHGAVRLVMSTGIPRLEAFSVIEHVLLQGRPGGRREAAAALVEFSGAAANALAMKALGDTDPQVQANVISQLRRRGIPGVLPRLVEMVDVPHGVVRKAVREALEEFTFQRYIGAFDMLDEEVRHSTGMLVKRIDPQTLPQLEAELKSPARTRRLRGLAVARAIDLMGRLEPVIIDLLGDEDHLVRAEAAAALAGCRSQASRQALEDALDDRNLPVREAAQRSLTQRDQAAPPQEPDHQPQD